MSLSKKVESDIIHLRMLQYLDEVADDLSDLKSRVNVLETPEKISKVIQKLIESNEQMTCLTTELIHKVSSVEKKLKRMKTSMDAQKKSLDLVLEKMLNDECDALINSIM